jgi:hypothetical protein
MKQIMLLLAFLIGSSFAAQTVQASAPAFVGMTTVTIGEPSATKSTTTTATPKGKLSWIVKAATWLTKKVNDMDQTTLLFIVLAALLGVLGIHRVVAGASPMIILWYILFALGVSLALTLLGFLTGGLIWLFGWALYWILPIFDIIKVLTKGISHFQGNNDLFAGFK